MPHSRHQPIGVRLLRRVGLAALFAALMVGGIACDSGGDVTGESIEVPDRDGPDEGELEPAGAPTIEDDNISEDGAENDDIDQVDFDPLDALPSTSDADGWQELSVGDPAIDREFSCPGVRHVSHYFLPVARDGIQLGDGDESVSVVIRVYGEASGDGARAVEWVDSVSLNECNPVRVPVGANGIEVEDLNFASSVIDVLDPNGNPDVEVAIAWRTERRFVGGDETEVAAHTYTWSVDDVYASVTGTVKVDGERSDAANEAQVIAEQFAALTHRRLLGEAPIGTSEEAAAAAPVTDGASPSVALGCEPENIGESSGKIVSAYEVSRGDVVGRCLGTEDERLLTAWTLLREVADEDDLRHVVLIAGYESTTSETLAFAGPLFDGNDQFLIGVLLNAVEEDPVELRLTMIHELAHVLTQAPGEYESGGEEDGCPLHNGAGCFVPGSMMARWVQQFWSPEQLDSLPESGDIDEPGGADRCTIDPTFLGSYAASHPEEDFAETLAAFVFEIDVAPEVQPKLDFMSEQQAFVDMQQRAWAAGVTDLPNNFEACG